MAKHDGIRRPELARMVQGRGAFLDDIKLPGMCFAVFVRSQYAHANIKSINVDEALNVPGAIGVITPDEVLPYVNPIRAGVPRFQRFRTSLRPVPGASGQGCLRGRSHRCRRCRYTSCRPGHGRVGDDRIRAPAGNE